MMHYITSKIKIELHVVAFAIIIIFNVTLMVYFLYLIITKNNPSKTTPTHPKIGSSGEKDLEVNFVSKFLMYQYNNVLNYTQLLDKHDDFSIFNVINNIDCRMQALGKTFSEMSSHESIKELTELENDIVCISKYILQKQEHMTPVSIDILSQCVRTSHFGYKFERLPQKLHDKYHKRRLVEDNIYPRRRT